MGLDSVVAVVFGCRFCVEISGVEVVNYDGSFVY